jgi:hypothetical protein
LKHEADDVLSHRLVVERPESQEGLKQLNKRDVVTGADLRRARISRRVETSYDTQGSVAVGFQNLKKG